MHKPKSKLLKITEVLLNNYHKIDKMSLQEKNILKRAVIDAGRRPVKDKKTSVLETLVNGVNLLDNLSKRDKKVFKSIVEVVLREQGPDDINSSSYSLSKPDGGVDVDKFEKLFNGPLKPWLDKIDKPDEFKELLLSLFDRISPSLQTSGTLKNIFLAMANGYMDRGKANKEKEEFASKI